MNNYSNQISKTEYDIVVANHINARLLKEIVDKTQDPTCWNSVNLDCVLAECYLSAQSGNYSRTMVGYEKPFNTILINQLSGLGFTVSTYQDPSSDSASNGLWNLDVQWNIVDEFPQQPANKR